MRLNQDDGKQAGMMIFVRHQHLDRPDTAVIHPLERHRSCLGTKAETQAFISWFLLWTLPAADSGSSASRGTFHW